MAINNISSATTSATLFSASILLLLIASCSSTSFGNVLKTGDKLNTGGILSIGNYKFTMQSDCNLVLYDSDTAIWASRTPGMGTNCYLVLGNGELLIYSGSGTTVWRSETGGGYGNYALVLQPNGNVVVYGSPIWSTGTFSPSRTSYAPPRKTIYAPPRKHVPNNP